MTEPATKPATISEFLEARWAEEERVARSAGGDVATASIDNYGHLTVPAFRFLDDIAAKRQILAECSIVLEDKTPERLRERILAWAVVRQLASIYSDHPDWREAWQ